jgi:predicted ribosomally synthesized peptide with SipW-like signal peptide
MGRHTLRIIMVLGVLVTLVGGTGIFAVFTDRATAGQNSIVSGPRAQAADLKIAQGAYPGPVGTEGVFCDSDPDADTLLWEDDDMTTAQFTAIGVQPGADLGVSYVCLHNNGSAALALTASAIDVSDLDVECTGDEAAAGDATCGADAGELSPLLGVDIDLVNCSSPAVVITDSPAEYLDSFTDQLVTAPGVGIIAGDTWCLAIHVTYPTPADEAIAQRAQTDQVTWRFAFDGTAS